jgi:hypothetical protein
VPGFGTPAEEMNGKLRLLHRIATALALMSVGALVSISKLSLRMWGEEENASVRDKSEERAARRRQLGAEE